MDSEAMGLPCRIMETNRCCTICGLYKIPNADLVRTLETRSNCHTLHACYYT